MGRVLFVCARLPAWIERSRPFAERSMISANEQALNDIRQCLQVSAADASP